MSHAATERMTVEQASERLPDSEQRVSTILARLRPHLLVEPPLRVLDIGAAQGRSLIALRRIGHDPVGVEPWDEAREVARQLAERHGCPIDIRAGSAEAIPCDDDSFDVVLATSVMEHVRDLETSLREIHRVLRPGGLFWFTSPSALCPRQHEIAFFPLFGWYPDRLKKRLMIWTQHNRPQWVGYTDAPALHWFTPAKARRKLREAGFGEIWDRWDLRQADEDTGIRRRLLPLIRSHRLARLAADVVVTGCSYATRKP